MKGFKVIEGGALTTVQDNGRWGYQHMGVPVAGVMDQPSMQLANWLVGNSVNRAVLECTFSGPALLFLCDCQFAVTGAQIPVLLNDEPVRQYCTLDAKKGSLLSFGQLQSGLRFYIAFSSGINVPSIMESRSTYLRAKIGGYHGRRLNPEDEIKLHDNIGETVQRYLADDKLPNFHHEYTARVIGGTEANRFTIPGLNTFLTSEYTISALSDRMGYRLKGPVIEHKDAADIISSGIPSGSVQVTGDGQPIIMMVDRQTIGGYTKIAHVIQADIPVLAQMRPGDKLRFKEITLKEAQQLIREDDIRNRFLRN